VKFSVVVTASQNLGIVKINMKVWKVLKMPSDVSFLTWVVAFWIMLIHPGD